MSLPVFLSLFAAALVSGQGLYYGQIREFDGPGAAEAFFARRVRPVLLLLVALLLFLLASTLVLGRARVELWFQGFLITDLPFSMLSGMVVSACLLAFRHPVMRARRGARAASLGMLLFLVAVWMLMRPYLASFEASIHSHRRGREALLEGHQSFEAVVRLETEEALKAVASDPLSFGLRLLTTTRVNLRRGPGTRHEILETLPEGAAVRFPRGGTWRDGWLEVIFRNRRGWLKDEYVVLPFVKSEAGWVGWNHRPYHALKRTLVLRERPDSRAPSVAAVGPSAVLVLEDQQGLWLKVRHGRLAGWVRASQVRLADKGEAGKAYGLAARFVVQYVFPEPTLVEKLYGLLWGIGLALIMALLLPRISETLQMWLFGAKFLVTFSYFMWRHFDRFLTYSQNELVAASAAAFGLAFFAEWVGEGIARGIIGFFRNLRRA